MSSLPPAVPVLAPGRFPETGWLLVGDAYKENGAGLTSKTPPALCVGDTDSPSTHIRRT